ncbi:MAG: alkaline phosphatase family protein [Chloroflexota bacterium]
MNPTIYISIDGVRPDAIQQTDTPALDKVIAGGASTMSAQSLMPNITLPCHTSTFFSLPASRHGVISNDWAPMARPVPSIFDVAYKNGRKTAAFHCWGMFRNLSHPDNLSMQTIRHYVDYGAEVDWWVKEDSVRFFEKETADFTFIYFLMTDDIGHKHGWMSPEYLAELEKIDGFIGELLDVVPEDMTMLIHADHGGHERTHGTDCPEDMTIPWMIKGPTIKEGYTIQTAVSLLDTAPTIAHLLNIPPDKDWEGTAVLEAFK